jgi:hypothetical protein
VACLNPFHFLFGKEGKTMELTWNATPLGWLAFRSDQAKESALPGTDEVDSATKALCARLLTIGGTRVAVQAADTWSSSFILQGGKLLAFSAIVLKKGRRNRCHDNSAALWKKKPQSYLLVTGWALNQDVWRRHTWLLDKRGRVIETTVPQELYFGVILTDEEAQAFHDLP